MSIVCQKEAFWEDRGERWFFEKRTSVRGAANGSFEPYLTIRSLAVSATISEVASFIRPPIGTKIRSAVWLSRGKSLDTAIAQKDLSGTLLPSISVTGSTNRDR